MSDTEVTATGNRQPAVVPEAREETTRRFCVLCAHCTSHSPVMCGRFRDAVTGRARMAFALREAGGDCGPDGRGFEVRTSKTRDTLELPKAHRVSA